jgi:hypothetical protein
MTSSAGMILAAGKRISLYGNGARSYCSQTDPRPTFKITGVRIAGYSASLARYKPYEEIYVPADDKEVFERSIRRNVRGVAEVVNPPIPGRQVRIPWHVSRCHAVESIGI